MSQVYLSFKISEELFAINVHKVLEVLQKQEITPVPNAPEFINGIINFRGEAVPVFDTRLRFNMLSADEDSSFAIVVLDLVRNAEPFRIGAVVDRVHDVISINDNEIMPVPPMSSKFDTAFLLGIIKRDEKFIMLIDIDELFSENEMKHSFSNAN